MSDVYVTIQKEDVDIHVSLLRAANIVFPNTIANVLTDHNTAVHNALDIDADTVDGEEAADIVTNARVKTHFPDAIGDIITGHNKAIHDALNIDADKVDGWHSQDLIPAGSIIPWIGGYFTNGANGGYARVLGSANTIAGANGYLNAKGWYICDGAALNDADSPIFNGAGRYLPNLSDDRFIMGDNAAGGPGTFGAHTHIAGSHAHGAGTLAGSQATHTHISGSLVGATVNHSHGAGTLAGGSHTHGITGRSHHHTYLPGEGGAVNTSDEDGCASPTGGNTVAITGATATDNPAVNITGSVAAGGDEAVSISGSTANGGAVATAEASALPKYLSCFYIMRVR